MDDDRETDAEGYAIGVFDTSSVYTGTEAYQELRADALLIQLMTALARVSTSEGNDLINRMCDRLHLLHVQDAHEGA